MHGARISPQYDNHGLSLLYTHNYSSFVHDYCWLKNTRGNIHRQESILIFHFCFRSSILALIIAPPYQIIWKGRAVVLDLKFLGELGSNMGNCDVSIQFWVHCLHYRCIHSYLELDGELSFRGREKQYQEDLNFPIGSLHCYIPRHYQSDV